MAPVELGCLEALSGGKGFGLPSLGSANPAKAIIASGFDALPKRLQSLGHFAVWLCISAALALTMFFAFSILLSHIGFVATIIAASVIGIASLVFAIFAIHAFSQIFFAPKEEKDEKKDEGMRLYMVFGNDKGIKPTDHKEEPTAKAEEAIVQVVDLSDLQKNLSTRVSALDKKVDNCIHNISGINNKLDNISTQLTTTVRHRKPFRSSSCGNLSVIEY